MQISLCVLILCLKNSSFLSLPNHLISSVRAPTSAWVPAPCAAAYNMPLHRKLRWYRAYLICIPSLKDHTIALPVLYYLKSLLFVQFLSGFLVIYGRTSLVPITPSCSQACKLCLTNTFYLSLVMVAAFVGGYSILKTLETFHPRKLWILSVYSS